MNRRDFFHQASCSLVAALSTRCASSTGDRRTRIEQLMARLHQRNEFTGEILVAEKGNVMYAGAFGLADRNTGQSYTTNTRSCLASLSKPITAAGIMMLADQSRLTFEDPLSKFLTGFSGVLGSVTIRHLLTHTSGIPDYPDLNVDHPGITNAEILAALQKVQRPTFPPAWTPRSSSRVSIRRQMSVARGYDRRAGADDFLGMESGSGGVYSTVKDLLRFDQALYTDSPVKQQTLAEAFTPFPVREGRSTYGFGWNIITDADGTRVWHQGNTAGFRAFIERRLADRITVIMLTNGGDTDRMAINESIQRILKVVPA